MDDCDKQFRAAIREASCPELLAASFLLSGRRNFAIFVGVVLAGVILAFDWNPLLFGLPVLALLVAAGQHRYLRWVREETQRRGQEVHY